MLHGDCRLARPVSSGAAAGAAELLDLAIGAATAAGALLAGRGSPEVIATKSSPTDIVTAMDEASEALIREHILAARPSDAILGEEGGQHGTGTVRWIVDPLDGTVNYLYGLPDWAVSIAAERDRTVVAAVVYVPSRNELFSATLHGGAWRARGEFPASGRSARATGPSGRKERLACNAAVPLAEALVATGFGYEASRRAVQGEVVAAVLPRVRDIRRGGSAAIDLCSVASGQVDAYYERGLNPWDIAAGALIAAEAGARVGGMAGREAGPSMTIAAEPALFAALHDLLAGLDPERDAAG
jgi:myo-inositol-1(or 4)-monophosphatase